MENRKVWVFYAVVVALWAIGFATTLTRHGAASRNQQSRGMVAGAPSAAAPGFALRN